MIYSYFEIMREPLFFHRFAPIDLESCSNPLKMCKSSSIDFKT